MSRNAGTTICRGLAVAVVLTIAQDAAAQPTTGQSEALTDRQREIALALSACPASLADKAGVYVLGASGYTKARESQNGFTAIVQHALPSSDAPQCMDPEGSRTFLPRIIKVAELRAQGKAPEEIQTIVSGAITSGEIPAPSHPGVIYMLSAHNRTPNAKGNVVPFPPHVMFYGTHLTNADLGLDGADLGPNGNPKGAVFVAAEGSPYALVIVPVSPGGADNGHEAHK